MLIKAIDYIKTGFSISDAEALLNAIQYQISRKEKVIIDFSGITIFTALFFNNAFAKFLVKFGPEKYDSMFELINLSDIGTNTYPIKKSRIIFLLMMNKSVYYVSRMPPGASFVGSWSIRQRGTARQC